MVLLNAVIEGIFLTILSIDVGLALFFAMQLARAAKQNRPPKHSPVLKEVPSLSVCIPARNERHAMTQCLERVLASDYEKLEIVVFDDSSDDETSVLIRSFAHAGVRFVPGSKLPEGWLGKNHALDILAQEASGAYVVFMDVDAFIEPTTLTNLMSYMQSTHKTMVSVIPQRQDAWRTSVLFGPLRYFWQATLASPATSGAFWAIKRDTLLALGGLEPHKNEVQAEAHIATLVGAQYQWLFDDGRLGVSYEKKWRSQMETGRRLLYPMARGWRAVPAVIGLAMLNVPTFVVLADAAGGWSFRGILPSALLIGFAFIYAFYAHMVWRRNWWLGVLLWPVIVLQEFGLFLWSMIGYARHTIKWKGRPVTAPVVRTDSLTIDR
jgi:glycosyltransferase involved in cell wall biosynthesis